MEKGSVGELPAIPEENQVPTPEILADWVVQKSIDVPHTRSKAKSPETSRPVVTQTAERKSRVKPKTAETKQAEEIPESYFDERHEKLGSLPTNPLDVGMVSVQAILQNKTGSMQKATTDLPSTSNSLGTGTNNSPLRGLLATSQSRQAIMRGAAAGLLLIITYFIWQIAIG
jgi:hypothetical protein